MSDACAFEFGLGRRRNGRQIEQRAAQRRIGSENCGNQAAPAAADYRAVMTALPGVLKDVYGSADVAKQDEDYVRRYNTCGLSAPGIDSRTGSAPVAMSNAPKPRVDPSSSETVRA